LAKFLQKSNENVENIASSSIEEYNMEVCKEELTTEMLGECPQIEDIEIFQSVLKGRKMSTDKTLSR